MKKILLIGSYLVVMGSHIYMLFVPLSTNQMIPHAIGNLIAIGIIGYYYNEHKRFI